MDATYFLSITFLEKLTGVGNSLNHFAQLSVFWRRFLCKGIYQDYYICLNVTDGSLGYSGAKMGTAADVIALDLWNNFSIEARNICDTCVITHANTAKRIENAGY
jgi:hypothetical protein